MYGKVYNESIDDLVTADFESGEHVQTAYRR